MKRGRDRKEVLPTQSTPTSRHPQRLGATTAIAPEAAAHTSLSAGSGRFYVAVKSSVTTGKGLVTPSSIFKGRRCAECVCVCGGRDREMMADPANPKPQQRCNVLAHQCTCS